MLADASLSPQVSMTTFSVTKAQHLIFCWCFFFPSLSQRVPLDSVSLWRFAASWCRLVYLSLFFAYLALYLFCCVYFLYVILFSAFLSSLLSFPQNCVCSFPALPPLLVYAVAYVCTSAYIWGSYRVEWHTADTEPRQRRGEEIICLSVMLPVNIRSRETEIAIITWSRCWHPPRGLCMCACQSKQWTAEDQWS